MVSIIIPAYNEEAVIGRTLDSLLEGAHFSDLEVIVCCNGCSDRTAEIAREFGSPVQVLETSRGSKTLALNMGDAAARTFPRIYLDADISLGYEVVKEICRVLTETNALAAAPRMRVDLSGRNWAICAYYDVWLKTPYHTFGMIGSGVYALSEKGRRRFENFPDIIADDGFVRAQFAPHERKTIEEYQFTLVPPTTLSGLVRIKTRAVLGNAELRKKYPELMRRLAREEKKAGLKSEFRTLAVQPSLWYKFLVYAFVKTVAAIRARSQLKNRKEYQWERDETSRT